jgi:hypothetical protein
VRFGRAIRDRVTWGAGVAGRSGADGRTTVARAPGGTRALVGCCRHTAGCGGGWRSTRHGLEQLGTLVTNVGTKGHELTALSLHRDGEDERGEILLVLGLANSS